MNRVVVIILGMEKPVTTVFVYVKMGVLSILVLVLVLVLLGIMELIARSATLPATVKMVEQ